jgi:hypothetical protein
MQTKPMLRWISILGLIVIAMVTLGLFSQIEDWKRDLSMNYASLDVESDDPRMHPPVIAESTVQVVDRIVAWAERAPLWSVESKDVNDQEAKIHLTRSTRIFGWVDDIHVRLTGSENGTRVDAESKSRTGKGDLGQNPRNLRALVAGITNSENES